MIIFILLGVPYVLILRASQTFASPQTTEQSLIQDLFYNYSPTARPVINASELVTVNISFVLTKLDSVDLKNEKMVTTGYVKSTWVDKRLTWDPDDYGGLDLVVVAPLLVWLPDFVLQNRAGTDVYTEEHFTLFRVRIRYNGVLQWSPGGQFASKCSMKIGLFPFDHQTCSLVFGNWAYPSNMVSLTYKTCSKSDLLEYYQANGEWDIKDTMIANRDDNHAICCTCMSEANYPEVHFVLHLKRKALYYIMNIVVPSVVLSVLVLLVLWLPLESGERISMGVTLLLSFTVFLMMVAENVPHTSDAVPLIVVYVLVVMGVTCLVVIVSVLALILHHTKVTTSPPYCLVSLAWAFNRRAMKHVEKLSMEQMGKIQPPLSDDKKVLQLALETPNSYDSKNGPDVDVKNCQNVEGRILSDLSGIRAEIHQFHEKEQRSLARHQRELEWRAVAGGLDHLFFWILSLALLICAVGILVIQPNMAN